MLDTALLILCFLVGAILVLVSIIDNFSDDFDKHKKRYYFLITVAFVLIIYSVVGITLSKPLTEKYGEDCTANIETVSKSSTDNSFSIITDDKQLKTLHTNLGSIYLGEENKISYKYYQGSIIIEKVEMTNDTLATIDVAIINKDN